MIKWKEVKKKARTRDLTAAQWTAALAILCGEIKTSPELSAADIKRLKNHHRGPQAQGMSQAKAAKIIEKMGWRQGQ
jgi:hypothetical protein